METASATDVLRADIPPTAIPEASVLPEASLTEIERLKLPNKLLEENEFLKKVPRTREEGVLDSVRHETVYLAVCELATAKGYPISGLCKIARSAYYKWKNRSRSQRELENETILEKIKTTYEERNGILSYRQMTIILRREHALNVNHKRVCMQTETAQLYKVHSRGSGGEHPEP
ncbi:MAG: transposase [Firmicutes bacterium]|nr:transposase [Bacillota bacterium]